MGFDLLMTSRYYSDRRKKLRSPASLYIVGMYVTIYVTVVLPVSFAFLSRACAASFATTDSGPVRIDSYRVSPHPGREPSCWVP
ncbi:hypothetical protein TNCV_2488041 [Trichonephila clavipes]|nr:hypothetical protein TNCV_2488041 [Trichonephila clavipes]